MKSFIAATLLLASFGVAAPPDSPSPKAPSPPSKPNPVRPPNKLPDEAIEALKSAAKFILFSLEPFTPREEISRLKPEQKHHGFKILGSTELVNAETKNSAISTLTDAVKNSDGGGSAMCFSPRHSLRAVTSNGTIYDFVICFECSRLRIYSGEKRTALADVKGTQKPLDDILTAAKIPLAKAPEASK